ncbi:uncharacterized protein LOC113334102 [Papaver somniferum]|uniref:uncharacterized protein LOC113334092 n=1 Tax=Papaver somniferum TaxID=3469 RepID=UPI000E6FE93E|nr:uncharacterized protein LOC113334092 [Papaver somniferum]XP_026436224.1 uncharacterized protein LOC113334102 [Papaver somniferum]
MAGFVMLNPSSVLLIYLSLTTITFVISRLDNSQMICTDKPNGLISELQKMKLKSAQLESILEERIERLNVKMHNVEEKKKLIEEMDIKIHSSQTALISIKKEAALPMERVNALEEEVRLLWANTRKNNFDLHSLETEVHDMEANLEVLTSEIEKARSIVTEQWIQIQQLDQALQVTEIRILKAKSKTGTTKCTFTKFIKEILERHHQKLTTILEPIFLTKESFQKSHMSQALYSLKEYHHQLQRFVKHEMERNEFTATIANQEVVFFLASALVTFPILTAWMLLASQFS